MRLADRHGRNGPRCARPHEERGPCDCQEVFLRDLVTRATSRQSVDWRILYGGEAERVKELLYEAHKQFIDKGDIAGAGIPNAALGQIERLSREDGFQQLDEVWT